jgi:hypothetical protein
MAQRIDKLERKFGAIKSEIAQFKRGCCTHQCSAESPGDNRKHDVVIIIVFSGIQFALYTALKH